MTAARAITTDSHFIERALGGIREFMEADRQEGVYRRFIVPATASVRFAKRWIARHRVR